MRYQLIDDHGNDLGPLASRRANWPVGVRMSRWQGEELEVVNFVPFDSEDGVRGYVVVAAVSPSMPDAGFRRPV